LGVVIVARRTGWVGMALAGLVALLFLALTIDVDLSPRLQRGDWAGVAKLLRASPRARAITTVELGAAPGFHLLESRDIHGLVVYRFTSSVPVTISERVLREHVITLAHPEVLVRVFPGKTT